MAKCTEFRCDSLDRIRSGPCPCLRVTRHLSDLSPIRYCGGHKVHLSRISRRPRMAYLGQASLQPHARHIFRMAGQRFSGVLLLCCAPPGKPAGSEPQARMVSLRCLEFCGGPPGMGTGSRRFQPTAGMGGIPSRGRCFCRPCVSIDGFRICSAIS